MCKRVILSKVQLVQHRSAALNAIMQHHRRLFTLKSLHELKEEWAEAAEVSILCAKTVAESIPHIKDVWRPARFVLWNDHQQETVESSGVGGSTCEVEPNRLNNVCIHRIKIYR